MIQGRELMNLLARVCVFIAALSLCFTSFAATNSIPLKITHNTASVYVLNSVFRNNSATIKTKYYARLDDITAFLRTRPHMKAVIKGQPSYNHKLGQKRAKTIVTYLTEREVKHKNITTQGFNYSIHRTKPITTKNKILLKVADDAAAVYIPVGMYKYNSSAIKPEYYARLSDVAAFLRTRSDMQAVIHGYPATHRLAEKRAKSIVKYFVSRDVKSSNISTAGFGINKSSTYTKSQPVEKNTFNSLHTPSRPMPETPVPARSIPASATTYSNDNTSGYIIPHVYLSGFAGSSVLGEGKVLQPVLLRNDRNLFIYNDNRLSYGATDLENNPWSVSLGMGYRQIVNNTAILGGYVLGGYNKTATDRSIWTINPGIEALGRVWEFRANGYIPISKKDWTTQGWADKFGNHDYIMYQGHSMYDAWFTYHEEAGIGGDAEIGRTLFKVKNVLVKGYVNSYVFGMRHNDSLYGGGARVSVQPNTYLKLSVKGSYDNYAHTTVMVGVEVSLYDLFAGGNKTLNSQDLQRHLFDPIENDFGSIGSGNAIPTVGGPGHGNPEVTQYGPTPSLTPSGAPLLPVIPADQPFMPLIPLNWPMIPLHSPWTGHHVPERTNVWFAGNGTTNTADETFMYLQNGTYEHPYTNVSQSILHAVYDYTIANGDHLNAYIYFAQGNYNAYTSTNSGKTYNAIEVLPGESIWGRTGDSDNPYLYPATGSDRPIFSGGFKLDNNTSLNDIVLQNGVRPNSKTVTFDQGITLDNATGVSINDTQIGSDAAGDAAYPTAILMKNDSSVVIDNSDIYAYAYNLSGNGVNAAGIKVVDGANSNIDATNGTIIKGHSEYGNGMGIYVAPGADGNAIVGNIGDTDNTNPAQIVGISDSVSGLGYGLYAVNGANGNTVKIGDIAGVNFVGVAMTSGNGWGADGAYGLYAASSGSAGDVTTQIGNIYNSSFTASSDDNADMAYTAGLYAGSAATGDANSITKIGGITDSTFSGSSRDNGYGLHAASSSVDGSSTTSIAQGSAIANSSFTGKGTNGSGYGLAAESNSSGSKDVSTATTIIGDITTGSSFDGETLNGTDAYGIEATSAASLDSATSIGNISNATITGETIAANGYSRSMFGIDAESNSTAKGVAATTIGNISNSTIIGASGYFSAYGLNATSTSVTDAATTTIGNITDSTFTANDAQSAYGLNATSTSTIGGATTTIGNIAGSSFTGDASLSYNQAAGYGLYASSFSQSGQQSKTQIGNITSDNDVQSNFTGSGNANGAAGLYVTSGNPDLNYRNSQVKIGNIEDANFTGLSSDMLPTSGVNISGGDVKLGDIGSGNQNENTYFSSLLVQGTNITVGKITNTTFDANSMDQSVWFKSAMPIKIDGKLYAQANNIKKYLQKKHNTVNGTVCTSSDCS